MISDYKILIERNVLLQVNITIIIGLFIFLTIYVVTQSDFALLSLQAGNLTTVYDMYTEKMNEPSIEPSLKEMIQQERLKLELAVIEKEIRENNSADLGLSIFFYNPIIPFSIPMIFFITSSIIELLRSSKKEDASRKSLLVTCTGLGLLALMTFIYGILFVYW